MTVAATRPAPGMLGLCFEASPFRLAAAGAAGRINRAAALYIGSPLRLRRMPEAELPEAGWLRLRPALTGICGSDVHQACLDAAIDNPLSGLITFPHVLGHETVARVATGTEGLEAGRWVAVDPWLGCEARGISPPCPSCAAGNPPLCENVTAEAPGGKGRGMHLGNVPGLPGGFSTSMVAHRSQCHPLPDGVEPAAGVLADPLAVGWHAVERSGFEGGLAVVLGAGTIGLSAAAVLRHRFPEATVIVTAAWPHTRRLVARLGATPCGLDPAVLVAAVRERTGGSLVRPWRGPPWLAGSGADLVIDSVGAAGTAETALRIVRPRGRIVNIGVDRPRRTENTLGYYKEVVTLGSNGYGWVERDGKRVHEMDHALGMLATGALPHDEMLTHRFPLHRWRRAFATAARPGATGAIKVTIETEEMPA
ncbi:MAG: zinc-dependent alcohol dehydrogenase [Candidatus Dormibacteraceae bacterium]